MAFIAPKLIGGERAQTPLNDLGFTKMTQALDLSEVVWQQVSVVEYEETTYRYRSSPLCTVLATSGGW